MDKILIFILKRAAIFFSLFTFFSASIAKAQEPSPELAWIKIFDIGPYSFAFDVAVDTQGFAIVAGSAFFPENLGPEDGTPVSSSLPLMGTWHGIRHLIAEIMTTPLELIQIPLEIYILLAPAATLNRSVAGY
ncbi:MAG: hypothetical protein HY747_02240 [Elusimicrobia bacterium]|nr:hypothetical protein [Elusimicrobiota bacterium]